MNRVRFLSKIVLALSISLALALTCSCSSDRSPEPTYFYSEYAIKDCSMYEDVISKYSPNQSFEDIKRLYSELRQLDGVFLGSNNGLRESDMKTFLIQRDVTPAQADAAIDRLKARVECPEKKVKLVKPHMNCYM